MFQLPFKAVVVEPDKLIPEVTAEDLKSSIEEWLRMKYKLDVHYSPTEPIKQLEDLGLLTRVLGGMNSHSFEVIP